MMPDLSSIAISVLALLATAGVMGWHVRQWRIAQRTDQEPHHLHFHQGQFYRRAQTTVMLGLIVAGLPHAVPIMSYSSRGGTVYILVLVGLLLWAGLLAVADLWATRFFFGRLRDRNQLEQTRLKAQIGRIKRSQGNGHTGGSKSNGRGVIDPNPEQGSSGD